MYIDKIHSLRLFFEKVSDDNSAIETEMSTSVLQSHNDKNKKRKRRRKTFPDGNVDKEIQLS